LRAAGLHETGAIALHAELESESNAAQFVAIAGVAPVYHGLKWRKTMMLQSLPLP
jgi:hypothetical protein